MWRRQRTSDRANLRRPSDVDKLASAGIRSDLWRATDQRAWLPLDRWAYRIVHPWSRYHQRAAAAAATYYSAKHGGRRQIGSSVPYVLVCRTPASSPIHSSASWHSRTFAESWTIRCDNYFDVQRVSRLLLRSTRFVAYIWLAQTPLVSLGRQFVVQHAG